MNEALENQTQEKQVGAKLLVVLLAIGSIFCILLVVMALTIEPPPTFQEAKTKILDQYPDCADRLEVTHYTPIGIPWGGTAPGVISASEVYFLKCEEADIAIQIQKPELSK